MSNLLAEVVLVAFTDVCCVVPEVVLALLVGSFRFQPSKKEIFWQMTGIATPTVKGGNGHSQLPLVMERAA